MGNTLGLAFRVNDSKDQSAVVVLCHGRFKWGICINFLECRIDEGALHLGEVATL